MKIQSLSKPERNPDKYRTILGIDSSTVGVAWTLVDMDGPVGSGKIRLDKIKETYDRLEEITHTLPKLLEACEPDHIFIEMPIFVSNPATARTLTFIVGCIMTVAIQQGYEVSLVEPATWKSYIGYTNLTAKFQAATKEKLGKTEGKKFCDRLRKSQTQRILKHRYSEFDVEDNDISDSCAIALYGLNKIAVELLFEKNKEIAFDQVELAGLGLTI